MDKDTQVDKMRKPINMWDYCSKESSDAAIPSLLQYIEKLKEASIISRGIFDILVADKKFTELKDDQKLRCFWEILHHGSTLIHEEPPRIARVNKDGIQEIM